MSMQGKVGIVTGSGSGMGEDAAKELAAKGVKVVIAEINEANGKRVADEIRRGGGDAIFVKTDVSKSDDVQNLVNKTLEVYKNIHIMVANAGVHGKITSLVDMPVEEWDKIISIHLRGTFLCCKYVLPTMIKNNYGKIITFSSVGVKARKGNINYLSAKGGIESLTRVLAVEVGSHNISVNCIAPGFIMTPMWDELGGASGDFAKAVEPMIPLGRKGNPRDVSNVVCFLSSDESSYISGQVLDVNGALV